MPDVLYIHPAKFGIDSAYRGVGTPYPQIPMGIIALANLLQDEGLTVKGINYPAEFVRNSKFKLKPWIEDQDGVRLVMVDLHWYEHAYGAISVAGACRQALPDARILLGGITASLYAAEILRSFSEVDFIIRGDAEKPLRALARELFQRQNPDLTSIPNLSYRANGQVVENDLSYCATSADLDELNFVDLGFLARANWYRRFQFERASITPRGTGPRSHWLCLGRGCLFNCAFCGGGRDSHRIFSGRESITLRSVQKVAEDIQRLQDKGIEQVAFSLDPAILGPEYWRPLFAELRHRRVRIGVYNEHFQLPSKEFLEDFVQTVNMPYSKLALTLLSGSEKVRRLSGKSFSNQQLFRLLSLLKEKQVPVYVFFSLNLPGEERAFRSTLDVARRIARYYPSHLLEMIDSVHTLDPCSPMSREPKRYSISIQMQTFDDYYNYCRLTPAAQPGVALGTRRGFSPNGRPGESLDTMARQWNEFCSQQKCACHPVRRVW